MVNRNAHRTLMDSAVHVAIHNIVNASRLINIYDLNVMLTIVFPVIYPFISPETEHFCKCVCLLIVTPEFSLLHKSDHFTGFIGLILHILRADSKQDAVS